MFVVMLDSCEGEQYHNGGGGGGGHTTVSAYTTNADCSLLASCSTLQKGVPLSSKMYRKNCPALTILPVTTLR